MPHSGRTRPARVLTLAALVLAVVVTALLMFGRGGGSYEVDLTLDNAGQLVTGDEVKIGGVPVGSVEAIELTPDSRASIRLNIDDEGLSPLHAGTVATVRQTSLSGIANRYVSIAPGPNDGEEIPDGGRIAAEDGRPAVDLDQVLNTLDPETQRSLRTLVQRFSVAFDGAEGPANEALERLNPALSQSAETARELVSDQARLERFIVESADVVSQVASRPDELQELVSAALGTTEAVASQSSSLHSAIARLPAVLRKGNTTLVNLRATLRDVRPAVRAARPAAPLLADTLTTLRPLARDARPVVSRLRHLIDRRGRGDLIGVLRGAPALAREGVPALRSTVGTVEDALPVVRDVRPYTPDFVGGLLNGFGGTTGGYYDANGHYARISFQGSLFSLTNTGSLLPRPPSQRGLTGYRTGVDKRCPGAAAEPAPDGSNPFIDRSGFPCDLEDGPR